MISAHFVTCAALLAASGCAPGSDSTPAKRGPPAHADARRASPSVPPAPPRVGFTIPADSVDKLYADSAMVYVHPRMSGPYPRNVLLVEFSDTASQEARESAVESISGEVIGGDGPFYYVLIADDGTATPLWEAIDRLRSLPQVVHAAPETLNSGNTVPAPTMDKPLER